MALLRRTIPDVYESLEVSSDRPDGWDSEIHLLRSDLRTTDPYITVWLVCEFLTLLAFILFFIGAFIMRQPKGQSARLPFKTIFGSIGCYIISRILCIAVIFLYVFDTTVKQSFVAINMVEIIFYLPAMVLLYSIFYRIIHRHLESFSEGDKFATVILAHTTILGVLSALAIANCATRIASLALAVPQSPSAAAVYQHDSRLTTARAVIFLVISMEIIGWTVFILLKSDTYKSVSKIGTTALLVGAVLYFAQNLTATITTIQFMLVETNPPAYANAIPTLIEFFCVLGIYTGIIICSLQWQKTQDTVDTSDETPPSPASSNPTPLKKHPSRPQYQPYRPSMNEVLTQQSPPTQQSQSFSQRYYMTPGRSTFDQRDARMSGGWAGAGPVTEGPRYEWRP